MAPFKEEHILLIAPGSQTTLAQLGLPESFTPAKYRFPTRMFPAEKPGQFEPYKIREKRREVQPATSNGAEKPDVEMTDAPKEGEEAANTDGAQPADAAEPKPAANGSETAAETTQDSKEVSKEENKEETEESKEEGNEDNKDESKDDSKDESKEENKEENNEAEEPKEEIVYEEDVMSDEGAVYPIQKGRVVDWPCFFALLTHIYNTLSPPFHTPILIICDPVWTARDREILTQFIFEKFKTPAFCLMDAAVAVLYAYGVSTACVVDVGYERANVTAVVDFIVQEHGRGLALERCGGEALTDRLEELLGPKGFTREMCEQLKRSNITEILPPGTPLPGAAESGDPTTNPAAAASTGGPNGSTLPRGPGRGTQTEDVNDVEDEEGVLNVAAIVSSGNVNETLARREREKAERSKKGSEQTKPAKLPNSQREKATFQFEEYVPVEEATGQYVRRTKEIEVGVERFLLATPDKERLERNSEGILEDLAAQIHRTILSVPDVSKRAELWDSLIVVGNGSRVKGFSQALVATLMQKYMLSPSGTIFTSELPSNLSTPMATGGTNTPAHTGQQGPGVMHHPAGHGVNPLLVAATHANAPNASTPGNADSAYTSHHRSTGHSQTPTSIKTVKAPEYFPEWKDTGASNAPGATGAGGTTASPAKTGYKGMEEAVFLGAQVAAKVNFILDGGNSKGFLSRVEYNESGPSAIHEFSLC